MANLIRQLNVKFSASEFERLRKVGEHTGLALANIAAFSDRNVAQVRADEVSGYTPA